MANITWEEEKTKPAPKPVGIVIMKEICVYFTQQQHCKELHSSSYHPTPPHQCLTAPATTIKRDKSRICLLETLQGDDGKNEYTFNLPSQEIVYH